eukprot:TRINITY_DN168_c2_g1_i1.p1 TRINITY_DN168_c2_g1~~TRINITY_DN168_c2_g1_i1.p1  ORF type:complete len:313 (-),score=98.72 TRINITY_DN168_c2_g1_i1:148-1086(-)
MQALTVVRRAARQLPRVASAPSLRLPAQQQQVRWSSERYTTYIIEEPDTSYKQTVECPIDITGRAGEVAMFMYSYTMAEQGSAVVERLEKELVVLAAATAESNEWSVSTTSPFFGPEEKTEMVKEFIKGVGGSDFFAFLIAKLVQDELVQLLPQITADFQEIMRAHRKEVDVEFVTATELSEEATAFFKQSLQNDFLKADDKPIFSHRVDPSLVHGYTVTIRGITTDRSWAADVKATDAKISHKRSLVAGRFASEAEALKFINPRERPTDAEVEAADAMKVAHYESKGFSPELINRLMTTNMEINWLKDVEL